MRFGENHLPAAQRNAVMPSGDNEGEELDKLIFASRAFSFFGLRQASSTAAQRRRVVTQDRTGIQRAASPRSTSTAGSFA
jgi:hypothetical protein